MVEAGLKAHGVNPACAGMIPTISEITTGLESKPRVCGDDPNKLGVRWPPPR